MDRLSFITEKHLDNTGTCGADDCVCIQPGFRKGTALTKKLIPLQLLLIAMMFFVSAAFYSAIKNYATASAGMMGVARKTAISCSPSGMLNSNVLMTQNKSNKTSDAHLSINNQYPAEDHSGNGCPHQQAAGAFCQPAYSKRRIGKIYTC